MRALFPISVPKRRTEEPTMSDRRHSKGEYEEVEEMETDEEPTSERERRVNSLVGRAIVESVNGSTIQQIRAILEKMGEVVYRDEAQPWIRKRIGGGLLGKLVEKCFDPMPTRQPSRKEMERAEEESRKSREGSSSASAAKPSRPTTPVTTASTSASKESTGGAASASEGRHHQSDSGKKQRYATSDPDRGRRDRKLSSSRHSSRRSSPWGHGKDRRRDSVTSGSDGGSRSRSAAGSSDSKKRPRPTSDSKTREGDRDSKSTTEKPRKEKKQKADRAEGSSGASHAGKASDPPPAEERKKASSKASALVEREKASPMDSSEKEDPAPKAPATTASLPNVSRTVTVDLGKPVSAPASAEYGKASASEARPFSDRVAGVVASAALTVVTCIAMAITTTSGLMTTAGSTTAPSTKFTSAVATKKRERRRKGSKQTPIPGQRPDGRPCLVLSGPPTGYGKLPAFELPTEYTWGQRHLTFPPDHRGEVTTGMIASAIFQDRN